MADIFIKIDGIAGESQDATHPDEIKVVGWNWSVTRKYGVQSGSGGAAKATVSDLHFVHQIDKATPNLAAFCFQGKHIKQAVLTMRKAGSLPFEYLRISMCDVIITHVEQAGSQGLDMEHVSLSFARIKQEYTIQRATGSSAGTVMSIIDIKQNTSPDE
ncbi:Hcp family type VI secretion system effector [Paraburkholderia sp.]|uniref:Hcp family type VI secretion system effector n=1 Tax=Paraburkholderia sp. TaxID=1926495 RepID=UPI0039E5487C